MRGQHMGFCVYELLTFQRTLISCVLAPEHSAYATAKFNGNSHHMHTKSVAVVYNSDADA